MASDVRQKLEAAQKLFNESSTSLDKLTAVSGLLKGVHPKIDAVLHECEKHIALVENLQNGDVIQLSADALPESTEEEKKRKRALLLFIKSWKELDGEIARVQQELESSKSGSSQSSIWWRIFKSARGPLAVVTIVAIGIAVMSQTSVDIKIENRGCGTLYPSTSIPISIPGLVLPSDPLVSGGSVTATLPPLSLTVDGTTSGTLKITSLAFNFSMQLSSAVSNVSFDGVSLLGKVTDVRLLDKKSHTLTMTCS